ncbi:hypothetical protein FLJC2902T_11380 [Flavobacterium limnosediminis JC2902]|uniref:Uncharacterized protein n=1 Tax=Flavobacterium limnosediminis JC2902 TaxID=1341181 RepID=V6SRL4_9FLAO|nr:hypothetical protein FLJC2902T_11380 [Flavobacterium limnosediminis JC2902]
MFIHNSTNIGNYIESVRNKKTQKELLFGFFHKIYYNLKIIHC